MKPQFLGGYSPDLANECERLLVTLLRGLGPWRDSVFLIGGLTPRYLVKHRPPDIPEHGGTGDVDVVIDLQMLANVDAYATLEDNFKKLGFERDENLNGQKISWRWFKINEAGHKLVLELLADNPAVGGGKVQELPTGGTVSALNIPHSSMVFDFHETATLSAELLDGGGVYEATIRHADIVSFTSLKAFAFADRAERKDAHDLVYCLEHWAGGVQSAAGLFVSRAGTPHGPALSAARDILRRHFATTTTESGTTEGYKKDGTVAVALFEIGGEVTPAAREERILRQRRASEVVERLLAEISAAEAAAQAQISE